MAFPDGFGEKRIWYFAYGSNMKAATMTRRGITAFEVKNVVVPSLILTFDIFGIPYSEPSMASVAEFRESGFNDGEGATGVSAANQKIPPAHGAAYLLSGVDYYRLVVSEGGGVGYVELAVEAYVLGSREHGESERREKLTVHTLKAKHPWRPNAAPSGRYMSLLLEGCIERGLPRTYYDYLKSIPSYRKPESLWGRFGAAMFLLWWRTVLRFLVRLIKLQLDENGHAPRWLGTVIVMVYGMMWWYHDTLHSRIWGRGDGTKLEYSNVRLT